MSRRRRCRVTWALAFFLPAIFIPSSAWAAAFDWPSPADLWRVLTLQDYNTRVVVIGTTLLGTAAGVIGVFLLLRKRALLSDALSHASLPGIALAFIIMTAWGWDGKNLAGLIIGATVFAILGVGSVILIQRMSRLKNDAALGVVLSAYFGLGIALLGLATRMEQGNAAGLSSFIYGKTASMLFFDAILIAAAALVCTVFCFVFFKEFTLICFDADYAAAQGWPVTRLDFLMMSLVVIVTVIGLQAVGLILVVALLIIPPASARFWTHNLGRMLWLSALLGGVSGMLGSAVSALMANLPAGAIIVLTASSLFIFSMIFGSTSGLLRIGLERRYLKRKIASENLLRALYEWIESCTEERDLFTCAIRQVRFEDLLKQRTWTTSELRQAINTAIASGFLTPEENNVYSVTGLGLTEASQVVRKHRLWETYLITHADIAPGQVDWGADEIEHILDQTMIEKLEQLLPDAIISEIPDSPHPLQSTGER